MNIKYRIQLPPSVFHVLDTGVYNPIATAMLRLFNGLSGHARENQEGGSYDHFKLSQLYSWKLIKLLRRNSSLVCVSTRSLLISRPHFKLFQLYNLSVIGTNMKHFSSFMDEFSL